MDDRHPLIEVSEHVRDQARHSRVAVVFDLDSTLFHVSPRTQAILRALGEDREFKERFADAAEVLRDIVVLPTDYGIKEVLARTPVRPSPELARHIRDYWGRHFFSSHHLDKDDLYPSAGEYVNHLHDLGAQVLYLTGRNEKLMREGTLRALKRSGLPLFEDSRLFMKPSDMQSDENYKVTVLQDLIHAYDHIWFFENEPVIIEDVRLALPQIHVVFVNSTHSGKKPAPQGVRTIAPDFTWGLKRK